MHEYAILTWDDVEAAAGRKVPAAATVMLGLDGEWVELDLTAENEAALREALATWLEAGRAVADPLPGKVRLRPGEKDEKKESRTWRPRDWERGRAWGSAVREFADAHGYSYVTPTGKWYYSRALRDAYAAHIGRE